MASVHLDLGRCVLGYCGGYMSSVGVAFHCLSGVHVLSVCVWVLSGYGMALVCVSMTLWPQ